MSSSSSDIDQTLDQVVELVASSGGDDASFELLLTRVGALDPAPGPTELKPAARLFSKLRLAQALDHPSHLRAGAVRLLSALEARVTPTDAPSPGSAQPPTNGRSSNGEAHPEAPPLRTRGAAPSRTSGGGGRVILSFPRFGEKSDLPPTNGKSTSRTVGGEQVPRSAAVDSTAEPPPTFAEPTDTPRREGEYERAPAAGPPLPASRRAGERLWLGEIAIAVALVALARAIAKSR